MEAAEKRETEKEQEPKEKLETIKLRQHKTVAKKGWKAKEDWYIVKKMRDKGMVNK